MTKTIELLEQLVFICKAKKIMMRVAESCTGGRLASYLTKVPGSSYYFDYGIIAYSNTAKQSLLAVPLNVIERYGAVSAETALLMAENLNITRNISYLTIATTGICGPKVKQSDDVGCVYIAAHYNHKTLVEKFNFSEDREGNMELAVEAALAMGIKMLQGGD